MNPSQSTAALKALHSDLALKYKAHALEIEAGWKSLSKDQRVAYFQNGATDDEASTQFLDASLGIEYNIVPEFKLQDISTKPEFLLDHLKHRGTTSLFHQYCHGAHGKMGDRNIIIEMTRDSQDRHLDPLKVSLALFGDMPYGHFVDFEAASNFHEQLAVFKPVMLAGFCVPRSIGEMILKRQLLIIQKLNILIYNILYLGSQSRQEIERPKRYEQTPSAALSKLTIQERPKKLALSDLVSSAQDQKDTFEEYLGLLSADQDMLAHAMSIWFVSRPETVTDGQGGHLPAFSSNNINGAIFDSIHHTIKGATVWNYMCRLLHLLKDSTTDKMYRSFILQETSNICHLEYSRAQAQFTRHVQTGVGAKYFRRIANSHDSAGNAKTKMKIQPEELTRADPHLHYILRLCQPQTNASKAVEWIQRLSNLYQSHPIEREGLAGREVDSLEYLTVITAFIQDLTPVISMPAFSRKKAQTFVLRFQELDVELNKLRNEVNLKVIWEPKGNLLDPEMASRILTEFNQFVVCKTGSKMGFLYQDLMEDCLADLEHQYLATKAKLKNIDYVPLPAAAAPQSADEKIEQRKVKEKTRPCQSTIFEIVFKVSQPVSQVFSTLFNKSKARGSINWAAFEGAMAELGFSVTPKYGSAYTFAPPESMNVSKCYTVHRPHRSRIEGYLIPIFARRLTRTYGWSEEVKSLPGPQAADAAGIKHERPAELPNRKLDDEWDRVIPPAPAWPSSPNRVSSSGFAAGLRGASSRNGHAWTATRPVMSTSDQNFGKGKTL
ncbi:hypothetical protein MKX08_000766 [Trichoderma sp. CBMAI-0020]|nr:hypothetical protein MKX08_000766 [Trichoderma sp. CBMAI-0020]